MDIIQSPTITVNLHTVDADEITDRNGQRVSLALGLYDGSSKDAEGKITADQYINMEHARRGELIGGGTVGESILHETLEAFIGAKMSPRYFQKLWMRGLRLPKNYEAGSCTCGCL